MMTDLAVFQLVGKRPVSRHAFAMFTIHVARTVPPVWSTRLGILSGPGALLVLRFVITDTASATVKGGEARSRWMGTCMSDRSVSIVGALVSCYIMFDVSQIAMSYLITLP